MLNLGPLQIVKVYSQNRFYEKQLNGSREKLQKTTEVQNEECCFTLLRKKNQSLIKQINSSTNNHKQQLQK